MTRNTSSEGSCIDFLLAHKGGPFWAQKDRSWTIPKGVCERDLEPVAAAEYEFFQRMGFLPPESATINLGESFEGREILAVFAREGTADASRVTSGKFTVEWPKTSGVIREFWDIDRAEWMSETIARRVLVRSQLVFFDRLIGQLAGTHR